jgi:hypothetical protein
MPCCNEAVFNGGRAAVVVEKTQDKVLH